MDADQKSLKNLIARRHPRYEALAAHWAFLEETYSGGREWFEAHIFKYYKEGDKEFEDRVSRAYRFNHTREIVNLVSKYVFKAPAVRRDDVKPCIKDFRKSATRRGLDIDQFMRQIDIAASTFGRVYVVVDSTADGQAKTQRDSTARGDRVIAYTVSPLDVLDISFDEDQQPIWALIREYARNDRDPWNSDGKVKPRFRLWTRDQFFLIEEEAAVKGKKPELKIVEQGEHALGVVPIVSVDCFTATSDLYESPALINDIAYLDRAVANYLSNLDAIIQDQTFSQLAMPASSQAGTDLDTNLIEMGTKRVFIYNGEGGAKPHYLSPDPKQAELIVTSVKQIVNEIYHSVGVAGERTKQDNSQGIDNSSGVAKAYDFERVKSLLMTKAKALQKAENQIYELVLAWNDVKDETPDEIDQLSIYPDTFDTRGIEEELALSQQFHLLNAPKRVQQLQLQHVIEKAFVGADEKTKKELEASLKGWPEDPVLSVSRPSTVGQSPNGRASG